jgi:hypothetical protein
MKLWRISYYYQEQGVAFWTYSEIVLEATSGEEASKRFVAARKEPLYLGTIEAIEGYVAGVKL